jgi:nucleoside-diphosphate-sugar epimerase
VTPRVLVTGATGLIGRRVSAVLGEQNVEVVRTARSSAVGVHTAELTDPEVVDVLVRSVRPDVVLHLAGGVGATPAATYVDNVLPAVHLLYALHRHGTQTRVLVTGSAAEYGPGEGGALGEAFPLQPTTDYGRAKSSQTVLALELGSRLHLPVTVVRPFNVIADDLPPSTALGNFRSQLLSGAGPARTVRCGRVDLARDFITADDVAAVLAAFAVRSYLPDVVNICSGHALTLEQVMVAAAAQLGVELNLEPVAELLGLPAPKRVVGDDARLASLGFSLEAEPGRLARALLGNGLG